MSDLISRSALLKEIRERAGMWKQTAEVFCEVIEGQPTVEAVPVVHGEWLQTRFANEYLCSKCWGVSYAQLTKTGFKKFDFCPKCGADMRKKV